MRWKGERVFKNNKLVFEYGLLDYIKYYALMIAFFIGIILAFIIIFLLNSFRWTL